MIGKRVNNYIIYILTNNGSSYPLGHTSNIVCWNNHTFRTNSHITKSHTNLHIHSVAYISLHFNNCNLTLMHLCYALCYSTSLPFPYIHHLMFWTIHATFRQFIIPGRLHFCYSVLVIALKHTLSAVSNKPCKA